VPQLAVQRDAQGAFVLVVGAENTVVAKRVDVVSTVGVNWAIGSGLADGDQLIVSGLQQAFPGGKVSPKPADAAAPPPRAPAVAAGR
jgi:membrane fusion protein (multidrug efflux system)